MSRLRSAIGLPVASFVLANSDPASLPSDSNTRLRVIGSPSRIHEGNEVSSASFKPSKNQNLRIEDHGESLRAEGENHSLAKLVQSLQDRLDAHDNLFKKSYAREKDLIKENEELKARIKEMTRKEKRSRESRWESHERKLDRSKVSMKTIISKRNLGSRRRLHGNSTSPRRSTTA